MTGKRLLEDEQLWEAEVKTEVNCSGSQIKQKKKEEKILGKRKHWGYRSLHEEVVITELQCTPKLSEERVDDQVSILEEKEEAR